MEDDRSPGAYTNAPLQGDQVVELSVGSLYRLLIHNSTGADSSSFTSTISNNVRLTPLPERVPPNDPPPEAKKNLVLYTHGWNTSKSQFCTDTNGPWQKLDQALRANVDPSTWDVEGCDWTEYSGNLATGPITALNNAIPVGMQAGIRIANQHYEHVHLIAHSAGAAMISMAARAIKALSPETEIQLTYLILLLQHPSSKTCMAAQDRVIGLIITLPMI
jgi:hypothetical protein